MSRPTALIADDHPVVLEGLQRMLQDHCILLGTASNGQELLETARRLKPEIVVTDISMPVMNGIEAVRQLCQSGLPPAIILLSMHEDKELAMEALRAGGRAYVLKSTIATELVTAMQTALSGRVYVSPVISRGETFEFEQAHKRPVKRSNSLTVREREVLQLIAEGKARKEMSSILKVAIRTVAFHKSNLMEKLGLRTTAELTQYAIRRRLVPMDAELENICFEGI